MNIGIDLSIFRSYQGTEVYTENLIAELAKLAEHHTLIIFKGVNQFLELEQLYSTDAYIKRIKFVNFSKFRNSVGVIMTQQLALPVLVLRYKIDVLYSLSPFFSFLAPCVKINTIHDAAYKRFREFRNIFSKMYIQTCFLLTILCKYTVTSSAFSKSELTAQYGYNKDRIIVISGALPELPQVSDMQATEVLEKFQLHSKDYLFYVGSLNPRKNIRGMIKAFTKFIANHPQSNLQFVLAGNQNSDFVSLKELLQDPLVRDRIKFIGFVSNEEKVALLKNSKALFFASFYEGFGLPILEAQSLRVPVITSTTTSMPEVAGDGAILVDPNNLDEISSAIDKVLDEELSLKLIKQGTQNLTRFNWSKSAQLLLGIIDGL